MVLLVLLSGGFFSVLLWEKIKSHTSNYRPRYINGLALQQLLESPHERFLCERERRQKMLEAGAGFCHVLCSSDCTSVPHVVYIIRKGFENTQWKLNDFSEHPESFSETELF